MTGTPIQTLKDIFSLQRFKIPQYQRAYSWEVKPHLQTFLEDLRQHIEALAANPQKQYFLGTLLLHDEGAGIANVVDGQQRLTTAIIFIASALKVHKERAVLTEEKEKVKVLRRIFINDDDAGEQKFLTIKEDHSFFRSNILEITDTVQEAASPSSAKLKDAMEFFLKNISDEEWERLLLGLIYSNVLIYTVKDHADATLIFELQNDRGKQLSELEALKSYLMHLVYLNEKNPNDTLDDIHHQFSEIYRNIERLKGNHKKAPSEEAILSYHTAAYLPWAGEEWRAPKTVAKKAIGKISKKDTVRWATSFASGLNETYRAVTRLFDNMDNHSEFIELILLDRMAAFWPLLIKTYRADSTQSKNDFNLVCRLMEIYAMRGYGLSNLRADAGISTLYIYARDFEGDFSGLCGNLKALSYEYSLESRHLEGLDSPFLYLHNKKTAKYILWRYENHLRSQTGRQNGDLAWREYLFPKKFAKALSIEHIAAQESSISDEVVEWTPGAQEVFVDVATHRLGNLVLDSVSPNAAKGKLDFNEKLPEFQASTYLSQSELINWADQESDVYHWGVDAVKKRHTALKDFAITTWKPETYYNPNMDENE